VPELAGAWDGLVLRCLERDVERRFTSTEQVAAALEVVAAGPVARLVPAPRRRRLAFALLTTAALVAGAAQLLASKPSLNAAPVAAVEAPPTVTLALQPSVEPPPPAAPTGSASPDAISASAPAEGASPLEAAAPSGKTDPAAILEDVPKATPEGRSQPPARGHAASQPMRKRTSAAVPAVAAPPVAEVKAPALVRPSDVREVFFLEAPNDPQNAE
jgi:hypothetical protein